MVKTKKGKGKEKTKEIKEEVPVEETGVMVEVKVEGWGETQQEQGDAPNEKKGKKGKKGKKDKKEKKEKKEKTEKKPKGKKKKLTKKEKARLAAQQADELRAAAEEERLRLYAEEIRRVEVERILADERERREIEEQGFREIQLAETYQVFSTHQYNMREMELGIRRNEEWSQYLKCDGLPDPASLSEMNTYMFVWRLDEENNLIQKAVPKSDEVVGLLGVLDELIDFPLDNSAEHVLDWMEIRHNVRKEQRLHMDTATYMLLRNLEQNLILTDLNVLRYDAKSENLTFYLWSLLPLPVPGTPPEDNMGHTSECEFSSLGINVHMPQPLANMYLAIRALWVHYDHMSDLCPSWDAPSLPSDYVQDMVSIMQEEWSRQEILQLQYNEEVATRNQQRRACLLPFDTPGGPIYKQPILDLTRPLNPPLIQYFEPLIPPELFEHILTPAEIICIRQAEAEEELKQDLAYKTKPNELNLRRFTILGGVIHLDLLQQPPQPMELREKFIITTLKLPKQLEAIDFHVLYVPPPPPEPGQRRLPEEIEAEIKLQEAEFDKLCLVSIALPNDVLWFEPPIVAVWDDDENFWSTEDCHDLKFIEEKQILTFRTGRMGPMGLAVYRYSNLPFQAWEMKPCHKTGGVILNITAAIVVLELLFKDDLVSIVQLQNGTTSALQQHVGVFYKPRKLIKLLINGGVDLFPQVDAMCYVEGVSSKHRATEDHLYHCLAVLSTAFQFAWSRWNLMSGHRSIVLQLREYVDRKHLPTYSMLLVTPLKACIVDCTEVSQTFSEEGVTGTRFYCDLYHLALGQTTMTTKTKISAISFQLVESVYEFMRRTKLFSFS